ncbi:iron ABC transporter ATP-binding protein FetA [Pantoea graminicola]|uniref:iron efflux ABC transporter ATP-binding subunit FetA n=1 Tax=Pantoea sp. ARC607 TaxID=2027922 RepID=UPI000DA944B7|nr:iron ABC transporter ATP-binding protein FetA [Pantoea sp. ARC607]PZL94814.1 iron ABC transporter ATP-binding protein FetA [Pantoea sp. ARC607]
MDRGLPLLDAQAIAFSAGDRQLLQPISLQLYPCDNVLLTGPSGSGKSTLLKILASLMSPTAGQIFFNGSDITTLEAETYRQQVSYCFQTPQLFGQTVYDNLALPWQIRHQKPSRDALVSALESVNLAAAMLDKPAEQLSGGEKQRVGLLRNLQFMPQVLLLDEVTSALDEENRQTVLSLIRRVSAENQIAVVRISHDIQDIEQAEQVLRLTPQKKEKARESA